MITGKIFLVMIGFFIIALLTWEGQRIVKTFLEKLPKETDEDTIIEKNNKKIRSLKLKILDGDLFMTEVVSSCLGILASIVGIISLAWYL